MSFLDFFFLHKKNFEIKVFVLSHLLGATHSTGALAEPLVTSLPGEWAAVLPGTARGSPAASPRNEPARVGSTSLRLWTLHSCLQHHFASCKGG